MDTEKRVYEFSYLLVPTVTEEAVAGKVEALKKLFTDKGAEIISDENPEYIGLAYTIIHQVNNKNETVNSAYFGWFKMSIDPEMLDEIKAIIERDIEVLRYMIIKTVAENTLAPKKLSQKRDTAKRVTRSNHAAPVEGVPSEEIEETEEGVVDADEVSTSSDEDMVDESEVVESPEEE